MSARTSRGVLNWAAFESDLHDELFSALARAAKQRRRDVFYAVALHSVDRELDGPLGVPVLAAATVSDGAPPGGRGYYSKRFNPADWALPELPRREHVARRLERVLTDEATAGSQAHWRRTEARYLQILLRITRRLRDEAPTALRVTDDFICFLHDEAGGPALAARTIPRALLARLFARQVEDARERRAAAAMPTNDRIGFLVSRLDRFDGVTSEDAQKELRALGAEAVGALTSVLAHPQNRWIAAMLLGQIGVATPTIIGALRKHAGELWCATALGMLGDHEWLVRQSAEVAALGLCARYKAIAQGERPCRLDYGPLERYLDTADRAARTRVEKELAPGTSYVTIGKVDVGEALRGLRGAHAAVRWHAAAVLSDRALGVRAGKDIVPALTERLEDSDPAVRRIAALSLRAWRATPRRP